MSKGTQDWAKWAVVVIALLGVLIRQATLDDRQTNIMEGNAKMNEKLAALYEKMEERVRAIENESARNQAKWDERWSRLEKVLVRNEKVNP